MQDENTFVSLDQVAFLIRHPWLFIFPIIIIISAATAYLPQAEVFYQSTAIISFQMAGDMVPSSTINFNQEIKTIINKALLGENIKTIIKEAWPQVKEETRPLDFQILAERLKSDKFGVQIKSDKNNPSVITLSYISKTPEICYKILKAVIDVLARETEQRGKEGLKTGIDFLNKQVDVYKNRINTIEDDISGIKDDLKRIFPSLNEREKLLANQAMQDKSMNFLYAADLQKIAKYEESITNLSLQLLEAQRNKELLERQIKSGLLMLSAQDLDSDALLQDYSRAVINKERELAELSFKGYLSEHPRIKTLKEEIGALKELRGKRIDELTSLVSEVPEETKKELKAKTNYELKKIEFEIDTLKEKIALMEGIKGDAERQYKPTKEESSVVADKLQRLSVLTKELEINTTYYSDVRKRLEEAELMVRLEKEKSGFVMKVVEEPRIPLAPLPKKGTKLFMLVILAIGAGTILAFLADSLDNSIKTRAELLTFIQVPVLAAISRFYSREEANAKRHRINVTLASLLIFIILSQLLIRLIF